MFPIHMKMSRPLKFLSQDMGHLIFFFTNSPGPSLLTNVNP